MLKRVLAIASVSLALCLSVMVLLVVAAFIYENSAWVLIKAPIIGDSISAPLNWVEYEAHQGALVIAAFALGATALSLFVLLPISLLRRNDIRRLRRVIESLELEMTQIGERASLAKKELDEDLG